MIELGVDVFFLLYFVCGFVIVATLWFYYDWRQARHFEAQQARVIFHCIKCGCIYTQSIQGEESDCPQCGFTNGRLRF